MALSKSKRNLIRMIKIQILSIYILCDFAIWYSFIWFFIYNKSGLPFYGIKILFMVVSFILFLSFCRKWEKGEKINIADRTVKAFPTLSVLGGLIEIAMFAVFNGETYIYTSLAAVFACLLLSGGICSLYAMVFRFASNKSDLEENVSAFYLSLIFKVLYTIYFFFSCVAFGLILNYIRIREESYLNIYEEETLNEIFNVNDSINKNYENAFSDLRVFDLRVKNNLNQNILNINNLSRYINENYRYIDLKNNYNSIYININGRFLDRGSSASVFVSKDANNIYSTSINYGPPPISLSNNNNFYSDILVDNIGNISVSFYYPLTLINSQMGNIIANIDISEYFEIINDSSSLSAWNYANYKLNDRNVVYASDRRFFNQALYNLFGSEREFYQYIGDFESRLESNSFYITPVFNMNNGVRTIAIFSYIKNLNMISIYYKDLNSIIKNSY
ncbi:hypothetical protein EZH24_05160, partial [Brachyspira catarrhinii]